MLDARTVNRLTLMSALLGEALIMRGTIFDCFGDDGKKLCEFPLKVGFQNLSNSDLDR
mgnify:CR=1 FL=1